jgi:quaternary ammonium compound-resistance protein SugE
MPDTQGDSMAWIYLTLAGLFEIVLAVGLKQSQGFSRLIPSIVTVIGIVVSMWFLGLAVKTLPIGMAYAVWTGIGTVGTVLVAVLWLNEPAGFVRVGLIVIIAAAVAGLHVTSEQ